MLKSEITNNSIFRTKCGTIVKTLKWYEVNKVTGEVQEALYSPDNEVYVHFVEGKEEDKLRYKRLCKNQNICYLGNCDLEGKSIDPYGLGRDERDDIIEKIGNVTNN